jgi:tumor protein p53-inducible protein 3
MKAIWIEHFGDPEVLVLQDVAAPAMKPGCVRIRVHATSVNRADLNQRRGHYPPPAGESEILGLDAAGVVIELAEDLVDRRAQDIGLAVGDRVCALLPGGGYAQEVVVPAGLVAKLPDALTFEQGAAIPEAFLTAYSNLVWLGRLEPQQRVLVHAGASGVGTAAIQLARAMGATVAATAGSEQKRALCLALGAQLAIDYRSQPWPQRVREWAPEGVHVILDFVGAPYLSSNLSCLAMDGKVIIIGTLGGSTAETVDLRLILGRRLQVLGTALRSRPLAQKARMTEEFWSFARPLFESATIAPVIDRILPLHDAAAAHRILEANTNIGKVILRVD